MWLYVVEKSSESGDPHFECMSCDEQPSSEEVQERTDAGESPRA
jgi:hypothetical protein